MTYVTTSAAVMSALEEGERFIAQAVHTDGGIGVILKERLVS